VVCLKLNVQPFGGLVATVVVGFSVPPGDAPRGTLATMIELVVTRVRGDRGRHALDGDAWWRRQRWRMYASDAVVDGRELRFVRTGWGGRVATAEDAVTGEVVAEWRDGRLAAGGRELRLRRAGRWWKGHWALADESGELVRFEARGWAGGEMRLLVEEDARLTRPVLLFAAWVVSFLRQDDSGAAAAGASAAVVASG
jgi:hypothetical protein